MTDFNDNENINDNTDMLADTSAAFNKSSYDQYDETERTTTNDQSAGYEVLGATTPKEKEASKGTKAIVKKNIWSALFGFGGAFVCLVAFLVALNFGFISIALPSSSFSTIGSSGSNYYSDASSNIEGSDAENPDWDTVAAKVGPSVVSIQITVSNGSVAGSGVIIDTENRYIVTNNHVVSQATDDNMKVTLEDGRIFSAKVKGTDPSTDLAVIQLSDKATKLTKAAFLKDSEELKIGQDVMAIGNPLGYANSATTGVISALGRPVNATDESGTTETVTNAIQIDAAINSGNSGGPLFDGTGHIIGITSSIATSGTSTGSIGIGFAIPSNLVGKVTDQLIKDGEAKHALLGASLRDGEAEIDGVERTGAEVYSVTDDKPAAKAGLKKGDVIVGLNDKAVTNMYSLIGWIREFLPGETVTLSYVRDNKSYEVKVTLGTAAKTETKTPSQGEGSEEGDGSNGLTDPWEWFFGGGSGSNGR